MKNFIGLAPIVIWIVLTIYSALYIMVEINLMIDAHYFNLILLAVTIISFVFGNNIGQLICFSSLFIGLFGKSTFLVYYHWFKIGGLTLSWIYLPLIIFYLFINYEVIGYWLERYFKKEN
jgi:hypothetical protein